VNIVNAVGGIKDVEHLNNENDPYQDGTGRERILQPSFQAGTTLNEANRTCCRSLWGLSTR